MTNTGASSAACAYSFWLLAHPNSMGRSNAPPRTHTEEFYQVTDCSMKVAALNRELWEWEKTYNTVRHHQSLCYLTP